ncbi:CU044_2847 family protein [Pantanalinema rosaneae CENA516]|uniref:CU044_2847 family protein n=1 Tax=Pantanalinema rosaneae TaxID=1620701 RepID=UPI003D6FA5DE
MAQLTPLELDDGSLIYIEAADNSIAEIPPVIPRPSRDTDNPKRGIPGLTPTDPGRQITQSFQAVERTIRAHTLYTLNAFKNLGLAEVSEVTLKFGVNVDVQTGVPYIANGKAGCSTEITVKCVFPPKPIAE